MATKLTPKQREVLQKMAAGLVLNYLSKRFYLTTTVQLEVAAQGEKIDNRTANKLIEDRLVLRDPCAVQHPRNQIYILTRAGREALEGE